MKRITLLLTAVLLTLSLCACGGGTASQSGTPAQPKTITVRVTINPEFLLALDEGMNILAVEAKNVDAQALLSGLVLAGKPYSDGMSVVLSAAREQGYLTDGGTVSIQVDGKDYSAELMEALEAPVTQFEEESGIVIQEKQEVTPEPLPASLEELPASDFRMYQKVKIDGETVYVSKYINDVEAGRVTVYDFFTINPNTYPGARDDICYKTIIVQEDGSTAIRYYGPRGVCTKLVQIYSDGTHLTTCYENGIPISDWEIHADGRRIESEFDSEGNLILREYYYPEDYVEEITHEDGSRSEITYYSDGTFATSKDIRADGTVIIATYFRNGNPETQEEIYPTGEYHYFTFWENGNPATENTTMIDGTRRKVSYNEDGIPTRESTTLTNGTRLEVTYHSNGNPATQYDVRPDGITQHITFYEDGTMASLRTDFPDGTYHIVTYNPDGSIASSEEG